MQWQKCLGGSLAEDSTRSRIAKSIIQISNGSYVIAGGSNSNDGDVFGNHGLEDAWVTMVAKSGTILWQKCYGGPGSEEADCIIQTSDNGFAIAGWTSSNGGDVSGYHGGATDIWIVKLDFSGDIQWQKCFGGYTGWEIPHSIIQTTDGGYAISGFTTSHEEEIYAHGPPDTSYDTIMHIDYPSDGYVVKLNSSGELEWQKCFGGPGADGANSILQTSDGGFIFVGTAGSEGGDVSGSHGSNDVWIVKLDSYGKLLTQKCFGGSRSDGALSLIKTKEGGYIFAGETYSNDGDVSGLHPSLPFYGDAWVVKLDSLLSIQWQKCLGGSRSDDANCIIQTRDGGYVICGTTNSDDGDVSGYHPSPDTQYITYDIWVVKLNSTGSIQWQKCMGGSEWDEGYAILQSDDGGFAIRGRTTSNNGDVSGNHGGIDLWTGGDIWLAKLSAENSVEDGSSQTYQLWVYPDPSNGQVNMHVFQSQPIRQVQVYNLLGTQFFPEYNIANNILTVEAQNLPTGSYIIRVQYLNAKDEVKKFFHYR